MRLLAISGSLRADSYNTSLLAALSAAIDADAGIEWHMLDPLVLGGLPIFDQDHESSIQQHASLVELRAQLRAADVVVISTPEYNGSVPGGLKNAIDWASRPFDDNPLRNTPVVVLSASDGQFGGVWANNDLRKVLGTLGARVLEQQVAVPMAHMQFAEDGTLRNDGTRAQLEAVAHELQQRATALRETTMKAGVA